MADNGLAAIVLAAVGVRTVDHDARRQAGFFHQIRGLGHALCRVIHRLAAAAQDDVAIRISRGDKDGRLAEFGVAEESVRASGGEHRVNGDLHVA